MSDLLRDAIAQGAGVTQLQAIARQQGMTSLLDDAREKINQGLTTVEEVLRLLGPQDLQE
jgi:type II secretory ATPase GspE/PulE/Tfp pilus assembly ATPase PilB-like protein